MPAVDLLVRNARVVDGTGAPWFRGDVAVVGDRIEFAGAFRGEARKTIDAAGSVVCPGFIDVHTHSDLQLLANPDHEAKLRQGVTTDLIGVDGIGYAPLSPPNLRAIRRYWQGISGELQSEWSWSSVAEFLEVFRGKISANVAVMAPHGCLRAEVVGFQNRRATADELEAMGRLMSQCFEQGAVAFSTGLDYFPCGFGDTDEIVALCKVAAGYGRPYVTHQRARQGDGFLDPFRETLEIGRRSEAPVHVSHFSITASRAGGSAQAMEMLDEARRAGVDVTYDSYPYEAGSTSLFLFFPEWAHDGGPDATLRLISQPGPRRDRLLAELRDPSTKLPLPDGSLLRIAYAAGEDNRWMEGKLVSEVAADLGMDDAEAALAILERTGLAMSGVISRGSETDIRALMRHPAHMFSSDGLQTGSHPHPRSYGNYPRVLGRYVRDLGNLKLEDAVRRMTSLPAARFGLHDRGIIRPGMAADLVVLDPDTVIDRATYENPRQYPVGIEHVIVNGVAVIEAGNHTHARPGRALRRG